jgi:putative transposase
MLLSNDIKISMDGKGRAIDNIFIERLWRSVKYENVYLQSYSNGIELRKGLKKHFEFYNQERPHQSLNYVTPEEVYYKKNVA